MSPSTPGHQTQQHGHRPHGLFPLEGVGSDDHHWFVADHGAQVMAWHPTGAHQPVLWSAPDHLWEVAPHSPSGRSDGPVLRGGIPVCLPWFGRAGDPLHGPARRQPWERVSSSVSADHLEVTHWLLLGTLEATQTVVMTGEQLQVELRLANTGDQVRRVEAAHHTYLAVGAVDPCRVRGLAGSHLWDAVNDTTSIQDDQELAITPHTDRVHTSDALLELDDPVWQRTVTVERDGFPQVVVWNPRPGTDPSLGVTNDRWDEFVCLESAAVREHALELAPGATRTLVTRIRLS